MNTNETNNNGFQAIYKVISDLHALETQNIESSTTDSDLNKEFDTTEIMKATKGLKNDKSASGDDITNEMLKQGSFVFINALESYLIIFY